MVVAKQLTCKKSYVCTYVRTLSLSLSLLETLYRRRRRHHHRQSPDGGQRRLEDGRMGRTFGVIDGGMEDVDGVDGVETKRCQYN